MFSSNTKKIDSKFFYISYFFKLTDKTGTLTQNEMVFKRLHVGTTSYSQDNFNEIQQNLRLFFSDQVSISFNLSLKYKKICFVKI